MITDERLRWLSSPDYIRSEPGAIAAELLAVREALRDMIDMHFEEDPRDIDLRIERARGVLPPLETKPAPGFCPECLFTGGHKLSCSKAETPAQFCMGCSSKWPVHEGGDGLKYHDGPSGYRHVCSALETKGEQGGN